MLKVLISGLLLVVSQQASANWHTVSSKKFDEYRYFQGEIEAVNRATVSAQTSARIKQFNFDVDDFVQKGNIIVELTNEIQKAKYEKAKANQLSAKIEFEQSEIEHKRNQEIYSKKLISKSEFDQSQSKRDASKARYNALTQAVKEAKRQLDYTIIKAPYNGLVTRRFVKQGEAVNVGTPIIEGLNLTELRVVTQIPEGIIHLIKSKPKIEINYKEHPISTGEVTIFPYADKATRTFKTRVEIESAHQQLFPGMTVKVGFVTGVKKQIRIPRSAVIERSELTLVLVKSGSDKNIRHIKLGRAFGDHVEVLSGLTEGEVIQIIESQLSMDGK